MKPQQNSPQTPENSSGSSASATSKPNKASFVCKSSTTRWTPTSDQIRILKELYYNQGIRSPNAEQIQGISARLRRYGRIEGKNVFYWFQNHKARERQKIKFRKTSMAMQRADSNRPTEYIQHYPLPHVRYITTNPGKSSSCSVFGQMGSEADEMERSFRDFSIYPSGCGMSYMNGNRNRDRNDEDYPSPVVETLSLFPMHDEETNPNPIGNEGSFSSDDESWLSLGYGEQWND